MRLRVAQESRDTASYTVEETDTSPPSQPLFVILLSRLVCRQYHAETKLLIFEINPLRAHPAHLPAVVRQISKNVQDVVSVLRLALSKFPQD
jgi:hypothetical protein